MSTDTYSIPDAPIPAGAVEVADWYDLDADPARYFTGTRRVIARDNRDHDTLVLVDGTQRADGAGRRGSDRRAGSDSPAAFGNKRTTGNHV